MRRWVVFGLRWKYLSLVFLFPLPSCVSLYISPLLPSVGSWECLGAGPARAPGGPLWSPAQRCRDGLYMPCTTSGSTGLFWQGRQQWMGIITVSLQRELAEMKSVFNVQKSPCIYLKARGRERERQSEGETAKLISMGSKKDVFSSVTSGETCCRKGSRFFICEGIHRDVGNEVSFSDSKSHLTQLWPTYHSKYLSKSVIVLPNILKIH